MCVCIKCNDDPTEKNPIILNDVWFNKSDHLHVLQFSACDALRPIAIYYSWCLISNGLISVSMQAFRLIQIKHTLVKQVFILVLSKEWHTGRVWCDAVRSKVKKNYFSQTKEFTFFSITIVHFVWLKKCALTTNVREKLGTELELD